MRRSLFYIAASLAGFSRDRILLQIFKLHDMKY